MKILTPEVSQKWRPLPLQLPIYRSGRLASAIKLARNPNRLQIVTTFPQKQLSRTSSGWNFSVNFGSSENFAVIHRMQSRFDELAQTVPDSEVEFWFAQDLFFSQYALTKFSHSPLIKRGEGIWIRCFLAITRTGCPFRTFKKPTRIFGGCRNSL